LQIQGVNRVDDWDCSAEVIEMEIQTR
jgi:hypothetical protein